MKLYYGTPCMPWPGVIECGYGTLRVRGKTTYAHRAIYENVNGPVPDGMVLDHLCRNRDCVNPDHLEPVTNKENILRGVSPAAINARKTHCVRGHALTGENLFINSNGRRVCRTCARNRPKRPLVEHV